MAEKTVVARLKLEIDSYLANAKRAGAATRELGREITGAGHTAKTDLDKVGRAALLMAGGLTVAFGLAGKAAVDWESDWAGVTKTVEGTAAQMADLEDGLRDLAKDLPATHGEIAAVAEAAGALGIQTSAVEGFTKTMIDLGETTDLTADQAATAFARIANIMGTAQTDFDRMGSTLVELGNNGASTESEILELANRLAAAGNIAGLTEADILAMASTLASVGVEAEAGGTALSKVFTTMGDAVLDGSDKLDTFARVAGVTAEQFASHFREDPATAINDFVSGLGRMIEGGQSLTPVFEELELTDIRLMNALKSTAGAGDLLTESLEMSRSAWEANNALQSEAEKRYDTTAAKLEIARNNAVDLGISLGGQLLPALGAAAEGATSMAQGFAAMPGPLSTASVGVLGVATAGLGMAAAAAILVPKIQAIRTALIGMGAAGRAASTAMPWLAAAAAAVAGLSFVFGENAQRAEEAEDRMKAFAQAIRDAGDEAEGTRNQLATMAADSPALTELLDETGTSLDDLQAALNGSDAEFQAFRDGLIESAEAAGVSGDAMGIARLGILGLRDSALAGADEAERLGRVTGDAGDEASNAAPKVGSLASELGLSADEAERARTEFEDLLDSYRAAVDPLFGMIDALNANREALGAEAAARAEGAKAVADATDEVVEAEQDLQDARGRGDADGIAAAEERLADARERLTEVQDDAAISAEELAAMNQAVGESALDVEVAARQLAGAIAEGTVSVEAAKAMLQEWVDQGLITEAQAADLAAQFETAAGKADEFAGDYTANFYANTKDASDKIDALAEKIRALAGNIASGKFAANQGLIHMLMNPTGAATGGVVGRLGAPQPSDTELVALTPGEGVVTRRGMSMLGPSGLDAINSGRGFTAAELTAPTGGGGGSMSYDYSQHTTWQPQFTVAERSPEQTVAAIQFRLKRLQLEGAA